MHIDTAVAIVTGGNRGFGRHLVAQLVERGAKVYAAARKPESVDVPGALPLRIDLNDPDSVTAAAQVATDVTLLINNAGISTRTNLLDGDLDQARLDMETNFFGPLGMTRAFAPVIERNGGGAILNVLSVLSWYHPPQLSAYSAAKAASWAMTNASRLQLEPRGIQVAGLYVAYMDTDMAADVPPDQKSDPALIARKTLDELAAGATEILGDDLTRSVKSGLSAPPTP
ncbi:SDR family oxidoreductase [Nonomuraea jiangxiensis]|uniref:Short-chain dehydrogenase n=1 Tax=Nonomuraea jiangxiensis TaxID=633440 RepID=A0A1G8P2X1_9ACTN|nr:SDR family oxidoreductase [Nonomuraea jiangxiensis]SDI86715.1 Short-chain dehydrogenase [Nonomuraea jiangxiensis]